MNKNETKVRDTKEILSTIQFLSIIITAIIIIAITFKKDYTTFSYLSIISFSIAIVYFLLAGFFKSNNPEYPPSKINYLKGIYFSIAVVFALVVTFTTVLHLQIYTSPKINDILAVATLGITISTPYLTDKINEL